MLFPFHIFRIYSFGEIFYIEGPDILGVSAFVHLASNWFMPLLFVIAGISSAYALRRRTPGIYAKDRVARLLIPFVSGLLLVVPAQTYFAERFHNGYAGGYFHQYILFFTKETDLSGYTGGFTPAHLWFILYLFIISMIALPIVNAYTKSKKMLPVEKVPVWLLPAFFALPLLMSPILDIGGSSLGEYFAWFMLGYFVLSNEPVLQKLSRRRFPLLIAAIAFSVIFIYIWSAWTKGIVLLPPLLMDIYTGLYGWVFILALLGLGRRYLNFSNKASKYMAAASFPVYLFHQTWIVVVGYYILLLTGDTTLQMILIFATSIPLTFATYELARRFSWSRALFGIKENS
jgi:peptidoglycan/LPS O-acetylase OafA/YrhL